MKRSQRRAPKLTSWDRLILGFCTLLVSPKRLSKDPLFRFQRWLANLRILEIDEIKSFPGTPRSHAFIERLIGTIRREYLDQTLFWNQGDLERKLDRYKVYYNRHRCHTGLAGITPARAVALPSTKNRKPAIIPLAKTLQRPLSDPGGCLSCVSPRTRLGRIAPNTQRWPNSLISSKFSLDFRGWQHDGLR